MHDNKFLGLVEQVVTNTLEFNRKTSNQELEYANKRIAEYIKGLFDHAKFKVGDRVKLNSAWTHHVGNNGISSSWDSCKHFLIEGATATVKTVDFYPKGFVYDIMFDVETWIDKWAKPPIEREVTDKHLFAFHEKFLKAEDANEEIVRWFESPEFMTQIIRCGLMGAVEANSNGGTANALAYLMDKHYNVDGPKIAQAIAEFNEK